MTYTAVRRRIGLPGLAAGILTGLGLLATSASAAPSLGLDATDTVIGGTIQATAQLSALEGSDASGTISFEVFAPSDPFCSGPALTPEPTPTSVDGAGDYVSGTFTPVAPGVYRWSAHYSGDGENAPADANCAALSTVSKASPSLSGLASNGTLGGTIEDEASLSGGLSPSGEVTFSVYAPSDPGCTTALASNNVPLSDGKATAPDFTPQQAGQFRWIASYPGDANNEATSTLCGEFTQTSIVGKASPALSGVATSGIVGSAIKDEATLTGAHSPTGEVTFQVFAPGDTTCAIPLETDPAPIVAGKATAADFFPGQVGEFRWTASYPGDANNDPASTVCNAANQTSVVGKATPLLAATATPAVKVGLTITDSVVVSAGFEPSGDLVFRAFGPNDPTCAGTPAYAAEVSIDGNSTYAPAPFEPKDPGLYLWTVAYEGDADNNPVPTSACGAPNQASEVGTFNPTLMAGAIGSTVGGSLTATATLGNGGIPGGQLTFTAFAPGDTACAGAAAFSSTVAVNGNGTYGSTVFTPNQVGTYRWAVAYSGDGNHAAASSGCGAVSSAVAKANPTIVGKVGQRLTVGTRFSDTATLAGGFAPGGTITFEIYGPGNDRCDKPDFVNTVAVNGNGTYGSDPFVAKEAGRYRFVAKYSGDASNQAATEACGSLDQLAQVRKRTPKLKPRAKLAGQLVSIRARLANAASPTGVVSFRLFAPGDRRCSGRPAFTGALRVRKNGTFTLAQYIATKPGVYRLAVAYSGDSRNTKTKFSCTGSQPIVVRG